MLRKRKGFTLIELMIVIAIIAILAAILVPNFIKARAQGQLTACKSNEKNQATALEMYATDNNGRYPNTMTGTEFSGNYMKTLPTCPASAAYYSYTRAATPDAYTMWCSGASAHTAVGLGTSSPYYDNAQGLKP